MEDLGSELMKILRTEAGQGNSNTSKLTEKIVELNPELDYNRTKIEIVEALRELFNNGQIQIVTLNWELGEEFLYTHALSEGKIELA